MYDKDAHSSACRHRVGCHTYCLAGIGVKRKGREEQEEYQCLACLDYSRCELLRDGLPNLGVHASGFTPQGDVAWNVSLQHTVLRASNTIVLMQL
jgi:hypothetical protein